MAPPVTRLHWGRMRRSARQQMPQIAFFDLRTNDRENCKSARSSIRSQTMENQASFPYRGAIDADGHILEPPDTWERYIDPKFRDRAIRIVKGRDGLEILEIGGRPSKYRRPG